MSLGCTTGRAQSPTHAHLGTAFCCGWQRFLPRQRQPQQQRSPYSKLIANATGFFPPPLPASALHCFFPNLVPAIATATALAAGSLGNRPWRGGEQDTHPPERRGVLESPFHCQGDENEGLGSPRQVTKTALVTSVNP